MQWWENPTTVTVDLVSITLKLHIEPVAKGRPRLGRGCVFTPKRTKDFENECRRQARVQYKGKPLEHALSVEIDFLCTRPKRPSKDYPRGDVDNMCKSVLDALNEVLWADDVQVAELVARKMYAQVGAAPYITVLVREFSPGDAQCE